MLIVSGTSCSLPRALSAISFRTARFAPGEIPYRINVKCNGFRVHGHDRLFPCSLATASSSGRRLNRHRHVVAGAAAPPPASVAPNRPGHGRSSPDNGNLNPPSSSGHFVKGVPGHLPSSGVLSTRGRPKRCVRSGAVASASCTQMLSRPAGSQNARGRNGGPDTAPNHDARQKRSFGPRGHSSPDSPARCVRQQLTTKAIERGPQCRGDPTRRRHRRRRRRASPGRARPPAG